MGSEFKRLKRYNAAWTMIRALTFGVSACLLLLLDKLRLAQLGVIGYAGSMVAGLMAGAVAYWILRKSDLRLAEKLIGCRP